MISPDIPYRNMFFTACALLGLAIGCLWYTSRPLPEIPCAAPRAIERNPEAAVWL